MALIESMGNAISGMLAQQTNIDVISNNISNVTTTGFKSQTVLFKDVFNKTIFPSTPPTATRGGTNPKQSGLGVTIAQIFNNMQQGAVQQDGQAGHVLIQGNGFFILAQPPCPTAYTRDGSFSLDRNKLLVNSDGLQVQGWTADSSGTIDTSSPIASLRIPIGERAEARATTQVTYQGNLDASHGIASSTALSTLVGDLDSGAAVGTTFTVSAGQWVDQGGTPHDVTLTLQKTVNNPGLDDSWSVTVGGVSASGSWTGGPTPSSFTMTFDGTGALTSPAVNPITIPDLFGTQTVNVNVAGLTSDAAPTTPVTASSNGVGAAPYRTSVQVYDSLGTPHTLELTMRKVANNSWDWAASFPAGDTGTTTSTGNVTYDTEGQPLTGVRSPVTMALTDGSTTPQTFILDFGGTSQLDAQDLGTPPFLGPNSTLQARTQDGSAAGELDSFSIGQDGVITGFYTNGNIRAVGQLGVATFANSAGLIRTSANNFKVSPNSGDAVIGTANNGNVGTILSGALEQSNVDVTQEFTKMIVAQRAFQANSRVISVSDDLLNEALSILRR